MSTRDDIPENSDYTFAEALASPETRRRLTDAVDRPLKLRKVTTNLAAAATDHRKHPHGTSCETCKEKWPCVVVRRAMSPIFAAVDAMLDFHDEAARQLAGARAADLEAGIRSLIDDATRSADNCDAENAYVWITDLRALVGDGTPRTGEGA